MIPCRDVAFWPLADMKRLPIQVRRAHQSGLRRQIKIPRPKRRSGIRGDLPDGQINRFDRGKVQMLPEKYSASSAAKITPMSPAVPPRLKRGVSRSSRNVGCGMRWTRWWRRTGATDADGEVVWSWRPDAGVKLAMMLRITPMTVTTSPVTGESTKETVKTIAQGKPGRFRRTCGDLLVCFLLLHTRLRVRTSTRLSLRPLSEGLRSNLGRHRVARSRVAVRRCLTCE
jgi:hypothetical protein